MSSSQNSRFPAIWSEEGKYLASVLGDALVKGLTQVSQERPTDPVVYLANFLKGYHSGPGSKAVTPAPPMQSHSGTENQEATAAPDPENAPDADLENLEPEAETRETEGELTSPLFPPNDLPPDDSLEFGSDDHESLVQRLDDEMDDAEEESTIETQDDPDEQTGSEEQQMRDERGQSVLHFAASRPGGAQTIFSFLQNPAVNLAWRDENLKTCRDVAAEMGRVENVTSVDSFVVTLALQGQMESLQKLMLDGYDHLTDVVDSSRVNIIEAVAEQPAVAEFLGTVDEFRSKLLKFHHVVRMGSLEQAKEYIRSDSRLVTALGPYGRTSLHIAVLVEEHSIAHLLANEFPEVLKRGDHLERSPLHYAMGVEKVEKMTRILVRAGAKRVVKDLRGRQPSYYFINREEIALLQEQEQELKERTE